MNLLVPSDHNIKMKAIGVENYGPVDRLEAWEVPKPTDLQPRDLLVW